MCVYIYIYIYDAYIHGDPARLYNPGFHQAVACCVATPASKSYFAQAQGVLMMT